MISIVLGRASLEDGKVYQSVKSIDIYDNPSREKIVVGRVDCILGLAIVFAFVPSSWSFL